MYTSYCSLLIVEGHSEVFQWISDFSNFRQPCIYKRSIKHSTHSVRGKITFELLYAMQCKKAHIH